MNAESRFINRKSGELLAYLDHIHFDHSHLEHAPLERANVPNGCIPTTVSVKGAAATNAAVNRLPLNRAPLDGVVLNRVVLNRVEVNRAAHQEFIENILDDWRDFRARLNRKPIVTRRHRTFWYTLYLFEDLLEMPAGDLSGFEQLMMQNFVVVKDLLRQGADLPEVFFATSPGEFDEENEWDDWDEDLEWHEDAE